LPALAMTGDGRKVRCLRWDEAGVGA